MKHKSKKDLMLLFLIFMGALLIRAYQLSIFEFKNDQYFAIMLGNQTRNLHFMITHGMVSGVGVNNPPFFLYLMGLLTFFTNNPFYITLFFFYINAAALSLVFIYFYRTLPKPFSIITSCLLAISPAFTIYSNIIWAQCLLPFLMILFNICMYKFIESRKQAYFLISVILAALAAQFHMTGFFLFPLILILLIIRWKDIDKKSIVLATLILFIIFIPYLINLFAEKEIYKLLSYGTPLKRHLPWRAFVEHLRMASFDFFSHYFRHDFNSVLKASAGFLRFILYPLTWILSALFIFGFIEYIKLSIRLRKFFDTAVKTTENYPLPFQISGFMIVVITLFYFIFNVRTPTHYFIVFFPAYSIITGFSAFKIWKWVWGKTVVLSGIISTVVLLLFILSFLDKAGGHPYEYGLTYKKTQALANEVRKLLPEGFCPDLKINFIGKGKSDSEAVTYLINEQLGCLDKKQLVPIQVNIEWDDNLMQYACSVSKIR